MKSMYRTINPLSKSYILNESTKSKDQIIEELKDVLNLWKMMRLENAMKVSTKFLKI